MNTCGIWRGYMAKNYESEKFIRHVAECLSKEFKKEFRVDEIKKDEFEITMDKYKTRMTKKYIKEHQNVYNLDRLILEDFRKQGFEYDKHRSQYIEYCFGIYCNCTVIKLRS